MLTHKYVFSEYHTHKHIHSVGVFVLFTYGYFHFEVNFHIATCHVLLVSNTNVSVCVCTFFCTLLYAVCFGAIRCVSVRVFFSGDFDLLSFWYLVNVFYWLWLFFCSFFCIRNSLDRFVCLLAYLRCFQNATCLSNSQFSMVLFVFECFLLFFFILHSTFFLVLCAVSVVVFKSHPLSYMSVCACGAFNANEKHITYPQNTQWKQTHIHAFTRTLNSELSQCQRVNHNQVWLWSIMFECHAFFSSSTEASSHRHNHFKQCRRTHSMLHAMAHVCQSPHSHYDHSLAKHPLSLSHYTHI